MNIILKSLAIGTVIAGSALFVGRSAHAQQSLALTQQISLASVGAIPLVGNPLYLNQQIYGATYAGGQSSTAADLGAIFQYAASGASNRQPLSLHAFSGPDGAHPNGSLVADAQGNLYGTTQTGGADDLGTVFKLAPPSAGGTAWTLTTLHSFTGSDGANPGWGVTIGPNGYLYGTTMSGGPAPSYAGKGVVFTLSPAGANFRVMAALPPGGDPRGNVVVDPQGNVLGTTYAEALYRSEGALFKVTPSGTYSEVTSFQISGSTTGTATSTYNPIGNIVRDSAGNVYGMLSRVDQTIASTTRSGAAIYEVTAVTHQLAILAILDGLTAQSGIVRDTAGNLYGTTIDGGTTGTGSVFMLTPKGTVTTLASLSAANLAPTGGVVLDPAGGLWGTSSAGGAQCATASNVTPTGCGTLFNLGQ